MIVLFLISKRDIDRRDAHKLHTEGKHHEDDQDTHNAESLRHGVSPFDFVQLYAEEVDSNPCRAVKQTYERVKEDYAEEKSVEKQLNVIKPFVVG